MKTSKETPYVKHATECDGKCVDDFIEDLHTHYMIFIDAFEISDKQLLSLKSFIFGLKKQSKSNTICSRYVGRPYNLIEDVYCDYHLNGMIQRSGYSVIHVFMESLKSTYDVEETT